MAVFYLKQNDTLPILQVSLKNPDGTPYDLTGAGSVVLHLRQEGGGSPLSRAMLVITPAAGVVQYPWVVSDWSDLSPANWQMEYQVTTSTGGILTFPNSGYDLLKIDAELA